MTPLGKSVVFYFKYQPEMHRLYWKKQKQDEVCDPEVLRMVQAVGNQCCQEVGTFLSECGKIIHAHFEAIAKCSSTDINTTKWTASCGVWSKQRGRPLKQNWKMMAGVDVPRTRAEIIAWMWSVGDSGGAEILMKHFNSSGTSSVDADLQPGRIALVRIPISVTELAGFDIDREPLLDHVRQAFVQITESRFDNAYNEMLIRKF